MRTLPQPEQHFDARAARDHIDALRARAATINLDPLTLWALIAQYGPKVIPILMDVMKAFQGGFDWSKVTGLLASDGPLAIALIEQIAEALGITLPTMPPMESKTA